MRASTILGTTAISVLVLAGAGLVLSLQLTNPLLEGSGPTVPAFVTLALVVVAVLATAALGVTTNHRETPYW